MDKSVKVVLPSPIFKKCEPTPIKTHFISGDLPSLTSVYSESPLVMAAKHTKTIRDFGIMHKDGGKKFYKTRIQAQKPERSHCEKTKVNQPVGNSHLLSKLAKLNTPEDIAAWKEERRKRYPTVANVLLKQKALEQKHKRGERLESNTRRFGKMIDKKRARNFDNGNNRNNRYKVERKRKRPQKNYRSSTNAEGIVDAEKNYKAAEQKVKLIDHKPIKSKKNSLESIQHTEKPNGIIKDNALSSLSNLYGSSDDSEVETEPECNKTSQFEKNGKETEKLLNENENKFDENKFDESLELTIGKNEGQDNSEILNEESLLIDEAPEELPITHEPKEFPTDIAQCNTKTLPQVTAQQMQNKSQWTRSIQNKKLNLHKQRTHIRKQNTILEKLLEATQRHERNVLLQCVRFVCANQFFNKFN